jgi:hypothetical protein
VLLVVGRRWFKGPFTGFAGHLKEVLLETGSDEKVARLKYLGAESRTELELL